MDNGYSLHDDYYNSPPCPHGDRYGWCDRGGCDEWPFDENPW